MADVTRGGLVSASMPANATVSGVELDMENFTTIRFGQDKRIDEVARMLCSSLVPPIRMLDRPELKCVLLFPHADRSTDGVATSIVSTIWPRNNNITSCGSPRGHWLCRWVERCLHSDPSLKSPGRHTSFRRWSSPFHYNRRTWSCIQNPGKSPSSASGGETSITVSPLAFGYRSRSSPSIAPGSSSTSRWN